MLPKQLKDSQRHQIQPKQVELFLQSNSLFLPPPGPLAHHYQQPSALFHLALLSFCTSSLLCINNHQCFSSCHASQFGCPQFGFINTCHMSHCSLLTLPVTFGSELVWTSENESGVSRDLASAYVLCLRTLVVPNLQRDEGGSLGK